MKTFVFDRYWESNYRCSIEAETLEEALEKMRENPYAVEWDEIDKAYCTSTEVCEYDDEEGEFGDPVELTYDFHIKKDI